MNFPTRLAKVNLLCALFFFCLSIQLNAQFTIPPKPKLQTSLYDYADLLTGSQRKSIEQKLINYADSTSTQIVVITTPTIKGEDINMLGTEWGEKWGIGQKEKDNGIIVLIAKKERKISIQNGYGIESYLTDALSKYIIENEFIPYFKKGDYFTGIGNGTNAIFKVLIGKYKPDRKKVKKGNVIPLAVIFILIFIVVIIFSRFTKGGGKGNNGNGGYMGALLLPIILSGAGRGSWSQGSGGGNFGGGFGGGGFGGGGFGGGGASGGW